MQENQKQPSGLDSKVEEEKIVEKNDSNESLDLSIDFTDLLKSKNIKQGGAKGARDERRGKDLAVENKYLSVGYDMDFGDIEDQVLIADLNRERI